MSDRATILTRALLLEEENRALYAALQGRVYGGDTTAITVILRERGLTWPEIGARLGVSGEAARRRHARARAPEVKP